MVNQQLNPVWVVIPAAGIGKRMQSAIPKQYLKLQKKTVLEHTLECFLGHSQIAGIVVVLSAEDRHWQSLNIQSESKPILTTQGRANRGDSVIQGLKFLREDQNLPIDTWLMVHDAARPCLTKTDIDALLVIRETEYVGGLLAAPVRDTMKRAATANEDIRVVITVFHTESRDNLWHALTPQMFRLDNLQNALKDCQNKGFDVTDECSAIEFAGDKPVIIEGSHNNIKITNPSDIALATFLLSTKNTNEEQA